MNKAIGLLCGCFLALATHAQDIDEFQWFGNDYEDGLFLGLGASKVWLSNNDAPNPDNHKLSGTTFKIDFKDVNFEKGEFSTFYENKLLGDFILFFSQVNKGEADIYETESSGLSTGIIGWLSFLWNVTEPKTYQIAVGANFSDFFLTAAYPEDESQPYSNPNNRIVQEPNGNYYAIGPSIAYRRTLSELFLLEYHVDFSIPFGRITADNLVEDEDYPNPYFMMHSLEVISKYGLYGGIDYSQIINRGNLPNNTKRSEFFVGFRIKLK